MFIDAIASTFASECELVGLCDISPTRLKWHLGRLDTVLNHPPVATYRAIDFSRMLGETKPDVVVVCSVDATHHLYIIQSLESGCDVISEKPMTTDSEKTNAILDAVEKSGHQLRISFNYRYMPIVSRMRELICDGAIGRPLAVDFSWVLDTRHGADYFRRWHRDKANSGGLLIHKASHHFDLVNWWIGSYPKSVFAMGGLSFYGAEAASERGATVPTYDRYTGVAEAQSDPFGIFLDRPRGDDHGPYAGGSLAGLYLEAERDSGYIRDRNVFAAGITIEDTMSVLVKYENGVQMNYSLVAYSPWEGFRVAITGDKGRVELFEQHGSHIIAGQSDKSLALEQSGNHRQNLRVFPMFGQPYDVEVPPALGAHGGGDTLMLQQLLTANPPPDLLRRTSSHFDGAASILVGICANESMKTQQVIHGRDVIPRLFDEHQSTNKADCLPLLKDHSSPQLATG